MAHEEYERVGRLATSLMGGLLQAIHRPGQPCLICGSRGTKEAIGSNGDRVMPTLSDNPELLTVAQAAEVLGIGKASVYTLINRLELDSIKIGRRRLVPRAAVKRYVDNRLAGDNY